MKLTIDPTTQERVFPLVCECGNTGGAIRLPAEHGRESDEALDQELDAIYSHVCDNH